MIQYQMFSSEGNQACEQLVARVAEEIQSGVLTRNTLPARITTLQGIIEGDFPEVTDTEPQYAIAAAVSEICKVQGWTPVERWDW